MQNPDVVAVVGNNAVALETHYNTFGAAEGRAGNAQDDGAKGGRVTATGVAAIFDAVYYAAQNPDVVAVIGNDPTALYTHFITVGINEGRSGNVTFNVSAYKAANPDLAAVFGNDLAAYANHYVTIGQAEGRNGGTSSGSSASGSSSSESNPYARFQTSGSTSAKHSKGSSSEKKKELSVSMTIDGPNQLAYGASAEYKVAYDIKNLPEGYTYDVEIEDTGDHAPITCEYDHNNGNWMRVTVNKEGTQFTLWGWIVINDRENKEAYYKEIYKTVTVTSSCSHSWEDRIIEQPTCDTPGVRANVCTKCGFVDESTRDTTYAHNRYYEPSESFGTHTVKCKNCDWSQAESCDIDIDSDDNGEHHSYCKECGAESDPVSCSLSYNDNKDGTHTKGCNKCDYEDTEDCTYGEWNGEDDTNHTKVCERCGYVLRESHDWDSDSGICSKCGYECEHNTEDGVCGICGATVSP